MEFRDAGAWTSSIEIVEGQMTNRARCRGRDAKINRSSRRNMAVSVVE